MELGLLFPTLEFPMRTILKTKSGSLVKFILCLYNNKFLLWFFFTQTKILNILFLLILWNYWEISINSKINSQKDEEAYLILNNFKEDFR